MEIDTKYVHLRIKDSILAGTYKKNVHITLDIAKEIVRTRISFTRGTKMPSLILSEGVISIDKAAREYFVTPESTEGLAASAIITHSPFSSFLGNLFLQLTRGSIPVKIFTNRIKAEKWLQQFIE